MKKFISRCRIIKPLFVVLITCILFMLAGCEAEEEVANKAPDCSITSPKNGDELLQGKTITIAVEATDTDGEVTEVKVDIDNNGIGTDHSNPYQYQWNTSDAAAGSHTIIATAKDNSNGVTSDEITILLFDEGSIVLETGTVGDYDGNTYKTVKIGTQWWMAENLRTTHFSNGAEITLVENNVAWDNLDFSDKAYCYYDDLIIHADTYGALYNWAAAMNGAKSSESVPSQAWGFSMPATTMGALRISVSR
jgi:hypothetical protein